MFCPPDVKEQSSKTHHLKCGNATNVVASNSASSTQARAMMGVLVLAGWRSSCPMPKLSQRRDDMPQPLCMPPMCSSRSVHLQGQEQHEICDSRMCPRTHRLWLSVETTFSLLVVCP